VLFLLLRVLEKSLLSLWPGHFRDCTHEDLERASNCSLARRYDGKELLSQPIQPAEVVVFDIPSGLTKLGGNFIKSITLYEKEPERLTLVLHKRLKCLIKTAIPGPPSIESSSWRTLILGSASWLAASSFSNGGLRLASGPSKIAAGAFASRLSPTEADLRTAIKDD
jgi:hypothetical protein